jgi:hypothetical protein
MRLVKFYPVLFIIFVVSQTVASQTVIPKQQIALWDAVIAGDVTKAMILVKAGADVNGLDTRANVAGPNGRRPLNSSHPMTSASKIEIGCTKRSSG